MVKTLDELSQRRIQCLNVQLAIETGLDSPVLDTDRFLVIKNVQIAASMYWLCRLVKRAELRANQHTKTESSIRRKVRAPESVGKS